MESTALVDVSSQSAFNDESEVLLGIGCTFDLDKIYYDETEKFYIIKLKLLKQLDEADIKEYMSTSERRTLKMCVSLLIPVHYSLNRIVLTLLIEYFPHEKWLSAAKFHCNIMQENGRFNKWNSATLLSYKIAIDLWCKFIDDTDINCFVQIGIINTTVSRYYQSMRNEILSKEHNELDIICYQCALENTSTN